ncbi:MAG TPA: alpha/beta fold hydrolase [Acidimicrobiia bacterium]|nr:alpha/beta fold hydrolase [Acidimicrobiia bacterium]
MTALECRTGRLDWSEHGGGPGRPLLMVHALGADRGIWAPQMPALSAERPVILLDLPGHGQSMAGPGPFALADLGLDLLDVATAAGAEEIDLCGLSLGGLAALWVAANFPERVHGLVVSNSAARIGSEQLWAARIDAVETGGMESIREMAIARFFTPRFAATSPTVVEQAARTLVATDPAGYVACCAALRDADLRGSVGAIRCPTLVMGGDEDISTPPAEAIWLHQHIPGSRLRILAGAAHFSNLEQSETWNSEVGGFLREQAV